MHEGEGRARGIIRTPSTLYHDLQRFMCSAFLCLCGAQPEQTQPKHLRDSGEQLSSNHLVLLGKFESESRTKCIMASSRNTRHIPRALCIVDSWYSEHAFNRAESEYRD